VRHLRTISALVAAGIFVVVVAGPALAASVSVVDNVFSPKVITIKVGESVTWTDSGNNPHTVTSDTGAFDSSPNCPTQLSSCLHKGQSFSHSFSSVGTYPYHCKIHGAAGGIGMSGTIVVTSANGSPPPGGLPNTGAGSGLPVMFGLGVLFLLIGSAVLFRSRRTA
jgi:LPXTG-motif cell wall-anchored protein